MADSQGVSVSEVQGNPDEAHICSQFYASRLQECLEHLEDLEPGRATSTNGSEGMIAGGNNSSLSPEGLETEVSTLFTKFNKYLQELQFDDSMDTFGRILHNCLRYIASGLLHCSTLMFPEVSQGRCKRSQEDCPEFLKQLNLNCDTLSVTCFEVIKKNMKKIPKLSREEICDLVNLSSECLALATDHPNVLRSVGKIFAIVLEPFHHYYNCSTPEALSVGTELINNLSGIIIIDEERSKDTLNSIQLKTANYFGMLVLRFLTKSNLNSTEWNACLLTAMDISRVAEGAKLMQMYTVPLVENYPQIVSAFVNIPNFADEIINTSRDWDTELRIPVKLKIIMACSTSLESSKILISILRDIMEGEGNENEYVQEFVDGEVFPRMCEFIRTLNPTIFDCVQRDLLEFFIGAWTDNYSLVVADLIANTFVFIVQNLDEEAAEEYLATFSNSLLPPQIRYFIFPSLLAGVNFNREKKDEQRFATDLELMQYYKNILSSDTGKTQKSTLSKEDEDFLEVFWSRLKKTDCNSISDKLLFLCITTAPFTNRLDTKLILKIFATVNQQFLQHPSAESMLASCIILLGAKQLVFVNSPIWTGACDLCVGIINSCKQTSVNNIPSCVALFAMKCVCSFIDNVIVESENMALDLRSRIEDATTSTTTTSEKLQGSSVAAGSNQQKSGSSVEFYVPMFEKITNKIIESNIQLNEDDKARLSAAMSQLNDFMSRPS